MKKPSNTAQALNRSIGVAAPLQTVYADRVSNFAIGTSVSRLTFAMEVDDHTLAPNFQLAIPTPALFEALEFMATEITSNEELKKGLVKSLDAFREKLTKTDG